MRFRYIVAAALATAAFAAWGADVTMFRTFNETVAVGGCPTSGGCASLQVQRFDDINSGSIVGSITAAVSNPNGPIFIRTVICFGPEFADALVLNHANGDTTIRVTVDPSTPGCHGTNFFEPFAIDLTGRATGNIHISIDSFFTNDLNGTIFRGQSREDRFTDNFEGTVGPMSGTIFGGSVSATRNSRHEQVQ